MINAQESTLEIELLFYCFFVSFSGVLTTRKSLDRESIPQYNLVVNATDSGGMVSLKY